MANIAVENLIVGAGFSGATIARLLAETGQKVLVIDKKDHIAGNSFDYVDENGICIHKYGSHIFHTDNEKVWSFLKQFSDFNGYTHKVVAVIDGIETVIPFNINTLYDVFSTDTAQRLEEKLLGKYEFETKVPITEFQSQDDEDLKFLADFIYKKVFEGYSTKQWGQIPDKTVMARVPVFVSHDDRYFQDKYQGIPTGGYTKLLEKMLDHENIEVRLNMDFKEILKQVQDDVKVFYTGSIDEFFDYKFGVLPYRNVNFEFETMKREFYQSNSVINYPCDHDFTRIHEYKYYLNDKSDKTVIAKEYSQAFEVGKNERYYPIAAEDNQALYEKYLRERPENAYFLGRLGDYKYYDMDDAVERAMNLFEELNAVSKPLAEVPV
ncbi:MAG: UDP-galactopyranose mutase [Heliobacteriaceae bacterium]|jgi:UDP-galactopyranose mutase|nr:UDP-galactopyranose mutase [Heliobacteriaceae bacterium]